MLKKIAAVLLCAVISATSLTAVVSAETMQTASVSREAEAAYYKWNGKTVMEAGKNYIVTSDVTVSKSVTIPSGTTLAVQKGAKLWVNTSGKLYIKGKLNVKEGATLAVSGTLYQYKGKVLTNYGEVRFGSKSSVTLNGKTYIYSKGSLTGTPKKLAVGADAALSCTGKNSCTKLNKYFDRTAIAKKLDTAFTKAIKNDDVYGTVTSLLSQELVADVDKAFKESGSSLKEFCEEFSETFRKQMAGENISASKVTAVDVAVNKITASGVLTGDLKELADKYYKGGKAYDVEFTVTIKTTSGSYKEESSMKLVGKNGSWYLLSE